MIKVKKKNMLVLSVVLMAVLTIFLAAGGINAYLIAKSNLTNEIDIGNSDVSIVEDVTFPWELAPGIAVKKNIKAENTGKNNAAIRLRVDFSNPNMAERINYEYNSSMWTHDASSGYYYYNEVVAPGDTTGWLFDTFTIKTTESGTALTASDMEDFDILVYAESKPCDSDSEVRNVW